MPQVEDFLRGSIDIKNLLTDNEPTTTEAEGGPPHYAFCLSAEADSGTAGGSARYSLDDPELPEGSILIVDIRGPIMKESDCCSIGTEEYTQLINQAYAHPAIIGVVCLIDSPGGQLSGTPTLYDVIRNPAKPVVSVINEGMACSAALWLSCGSDHIYATQKTDQVGSVGVFVRMRDYKGKLEKEGIKDFAIYSDLSPDKNKPYRDALEGNEALLKKELNEAARLFKEAVIEGRGERLNLAAGDPFTGKVYYATEAIKLGLIDGFGNLETALKKVQELHAARQSADHQTTQSPATKPATTGSSEPTTTTQSQNTDMLGYVKFKSLAAIQGLAASDITEAQLTAINQELSEQGYPVAMVSQKDIQEASALEGQINTLKTKVTTLEGQVSVLTTERNDYKAKAEKFASLPGAEASGAGKNQESTTVSEQETFISETDLELQRLKGKA